MWEGFRKLIKREKDWYELYYLLHEKIFYTECAISTLRVIDYGLTVDRKHLDLLEKRIRGEAKNIRRFLNTPKENLSKEEKKLWVSYRDRWVKLLYKLESIDAIKRLKDDPYHLGKAIAKYLDYKKDIEELEREGEKILKAIDNYPDLKGLYLKGEMKSSTLKGLENRVFSNPLAGCLLPRNENLSN